MISRTLEAVRVHLDRSSLLSGHHRVFYAIAYPSTGDMYCAGTSRRHRYCGSAARQERSMRRNNAAYH